MAIQHPNGFSDVVPLNASGDGVTKDTAAIQQAIDACTAAGGGRVVLPPGRFLTGLLTLRSGVELYLSAGCILLASTDYADYPAINSTVWRTEYAPRKNSRCLIYAENAERLAITGQGKIDCQGLFFCEPDPNPRSINELRRKSDEVVPRMILFVKCRDFVLRDFTILDAPAGWSIWLLACWDGLIDGLRILADYEMPNADGLHINCCHDLTVSNCIIRTGDDALIIRAYTSLLDQPLPCERILVTNCSLSSHSSGIRIAWCNDYIIRDCVFSNLTINNSVMGIVLFLPHFESRVADQGTDATLVERLSFQNIIMNNIFFEPIHLTVMPGTGAAGIRDIRFADIHAVSRCQPRFLGSPDCHLTDIALDNVRFDIRPQLDYEGHMPLTYFFGDYFATQPYLGYVDRLRLQNTEISI